MIQDKAGTAQSDLSARLDVAMTQAHGSQGDVSFADTDQGLIGKLGAHLYIILQTGQKCGGGGSLSDVDGRIVTWRTLSIESALALSDMTAFEGSAGLGVSDLDGLD